MSQKSSTQNKEESGKNRTLVNVNELGRMPIHEKVTFFSDARSEVIGFGLSLSTFADVFESRPAHEYKEPVMRLLEKGVNFNLNP